MSLNAQIKILLVLHLSTDERRQPMQVYCSKDNKPENAFLVIGRGDAMKERFGDIMQPMPIDLSIGFFQPSPPI
jgi:hypothetical protein